MNKKHILVGLILLLLVAGIRGIMSLVPPDIVNALVVWYGDMETGDLSQWDRAQIVSSDRIRAVTAPVREGNYAMRVEVRQGDDPINASGNRNELVKFDGASEGTEFYYGWSTLWPSDYPLNPAWQVFMQWHHPGCCGAPPVRLVLGCSASDCGQPLPDTMFFIVDGQNIWTRTPVTRGVWHDFILHVKWSANPNVGFVELWYDGELVVPRRYVRTLYNSGDTNYLKMGLYRDESISQTAVMYHDGLIQGTTFADVEHFANGGSPTPVPTPQPGCHTATPGNWQNVAFAAAESGVFTAEADVTPTALGVAGAVSLSAAPAGHWGDLAVTVLFSDPVSEPGVPANSIVVRNGTAYAADATLIYEAGRTYHVRMEVDVPNHTYSVYVTPEGGSEVTLATDYAFRSTQQSVTELTTWTISAGEGAITACDLMAGDPGSQPELLAVAAVTASGDDGNGPQNTLDDDLSTRWSAFGDGEWIQYDLGNVVTVSYLDVAFFAGTQRVSYFDVQVSDDGSAWTTVFHDAAGSGMVDALQTFDFVDIHGRYVRIVGHGNTVNNWNSLTEVDVYGFADGTLPPPSPSRPVIFAVIGDYGEAGTDEEAVADLVKSWNPDFVITAGDNNYPDGEASTIDVNIGQYYHQFIHPYVGSYGSGASQNRFFPSLGNHDWHVYNAQPYIDYFALPGNEYYYEFSWNSLVHFFALDSQAAAQNGVGTQSQWLQPRLQRSREPWKIVYMHHPPYSSGNHGSSRFMQLPYESWGATAVMAGHDHTYERIFKGANNFPYFVNGLGGRSTYTCGSPVSGSQVCYDDNYGAMRVEATDTQITFQFITINGVVIDEYTLTH